MEKMNRLIEPVQRDAEPVPVIAPESASKDIPAVGATVPGSLALAGEQQKRLDLLNDYQERTHAPREARNAAIDTHETEWRERWLNLQGEIEQARATRAEQLTKDGTPGEHYPAQWLDFLRDQAQQNPDDLTLARLIEEVEQSPDPGVEGLGGTPTKAITLADLVHSVDRDGTLNYKRGLVTVIRDSGARLDVKCMDNRDIEAALKISTQKFDLQKGLMLTGDAAFKPALPRLPDVSACRCKTANRKC